MSRKRAQKKPKAASLSRMKDSQKKQLVGAKTPISALRQSGKEAL